jgi:hypothetical protein
VRISFEAGVRWRRLSRRPASLAPRHLPAATAVLLTCLAAVVPATAQSSARAQFARTLSVKDEARMHLIRSSGSTLFDEGPAMGTIPGKVKVRFIYNGNPTVSARITIYGRSGTIEAACSARLSNPTSPAPSFKGTLTLAHASGHYAGAHGSGHVYGVFNRRSYAITVQTEGTMHY